MRKNDGEHSEYRKNMKKPIDGQYKRITGTFTDLYHCHRSGIMMNHVLKKIVNE